MRAAAEVVDYVSERLVAKRLVAKRRKAGLRPVEGDALRNVPAVVFRSILDSNGDSEIAKLCESACD